MPHVCFLVVYYVKHQKGTKIVCACTREYERERRKMIGVKREWYVSPLLSYRLYRDKIA